VGRQGRGVWGCGISKSLWAFGWVGAGSEQGLWDALAFETYFEMSAYRVRLYRICLENLIVVETVESLRL
jgi:hypothetical protein